MRIQVELNEDEIKRAIQIALKEKIEGVVIPNLSAIKLEGSVKVKSNYVRKPILRIKAFVETHK